MRRSLKIAWLIPDFDVGSGGIRTILQNIEFLEKKGHKCDLYIVSNRSTEDICRSIENNYDIHLNGSVFLGYDLNGQYDIGVATYYDTVKYVVRSSCKYKLYFMQDYEPWFFPMSQNYLDAEDSYRHNLDGISIGRWLAKKINNDYGMRTHYFNFCADLNIYRNTNDDREKAICFIYQPDKPRRMVDLGLKALQIVQREMPDIKIYLYGSQKMIPRNLKATHLGLITPMECSKLYNKCMIGLCLSATNPSRIPFEMMACGLPVTEVHLENTIYDLPEDGCILAKRDPKSLASAMMEIIRNGELWRNLSKQGTQYMKEYPLERGYEELCSVIEELISEKSKTEVIKKRYNKPAFDNSTDLETVDNDVYFINSRVMDRIKNKVIRKTS